jgi:hypothetical protein
MRVPLNLAALSRTKQMVKSTLRAAEARKYGASAVDHAEQAGSAVYQAPKPGGRRVACHRKGLVWNRDMAAGPAKPWN